MKILLFTLLLVVIYCLYSATKPVCQSCKNAAMRVEKSCIPVTSITYRQLNCFCDCPTDWKKLSLVIQNLDYYKDGQSRLRPLNIIGTKNISCSDDELQSKVYDDKYAFLYIEQDTLKAIYDGALKELFIKDVVINKGKLGLLDVGSTNRQLIPDTNRITVKYLMGFDELNSDVLISFQQAIHHDSTYQKQFQQVEYQLIRKQDNKRHACIRYQDYGARFYLDVE